MTVSVDRADRAWGWRGGRCTAGSRVGLIATGRRLIPVNEVGNPYDRGCSRVEVVVVVNLAGALGENRARRYFLQTVQTSGVGPDRTLHHDCNG